MTGSSVYRQSAEGTLSRLCTLSLVDRPSLSKLSAGYARQMQAFAHASRRKRLPPPGRSFV